MVYNNRFVVAIKVNGIAQSELKDGSVVVPFNTEYSIHLRNKNRERNAVAFVYIDGDLVTPNGIVVWKNNYVDLERSTDKAVRFKFVSLQTPEAIEFGKDVENKDKGMGVIEVRWHYEKEKPAYTITPPVIHTEHHHHHHYPQTYWWNKPYRCNNIYDGSVRYGTASSNTMMGGGASSDVRARGLCFNQSLSRDGSLLGSDADSECRASLLSEADSLDFSVQGCLSNVQLSNAEPKAGCTVEGGYSNQSFRQVDIDIEDDYTSIRLVLKGKGQLPAVRTASTKPRSVKRVDNERDEQMVRANISIPADLEEKLRKEKEELARLELELIEKKKAKLLAQLNELDS